MIRDLLNQKKKGEISHFGWGGDLDKFGSFSHFFFTFSNSCKYAKKGIFCGGGGTTSLECRNFGYFIVLLSKLCGFVRANIFFFYQNISKLMFEKKYS